MTFETWLTTTDIPEHYIGISHVRDGFEAGRAEFEAQIAALRSERDALREALAQNICVCEYPYHGAQPIGVSRCERCNKHYSAELRGLLSIPASGEPARKP